VTRKRKAASTEPPDRPFHLHRGDVLSAYADWAAPTAIVSDGAYGVGGFPGDPRTPAGLGEWYRPHIEAWSRYAAPATTLFFWNTEHGLLTVHPVLIANGWKFEQVITWDKGMAHAAGNVNGSTIRRLPTVTEVVGFYSRELLLPTPDAGPLPVQQWMRHEWQRAGLALYQANLACGVRNAATRKYLTTDWLWYFPPGEMLEKLAAYANENGRRGGWPYYSLDGTTVPSAKEWDALRYRWNHQHGLTNVWKHGALHTAERLRGGGERSAPRKHSPSEKSATHLNQKPLELLRRCVDAVTAAGDVVWEPFGGLCTASVAAVASGRIAYAAEVVPRFADLAEERLYAAWRQAAQ
jgi:site-specific DNA-methyltransferase (adenine-specific)